MKFLLHACCAPCGAFVFEELKKQFEVSCYFYNPNIWPSSEYEKRRNECKRYCERNKIPFVEERYEPEIWDNKVKGLESEPEGGKRCEKCFELRLTKTTEYAKNNNFDFFATTLTISPHKDSNTINKIGREVGEKLDIAFFEADWKKNDGYKKSCEISKKKGFYRQNYCGCRYSLSKNNLAKNDTP